MAGYYHEELAKGRWKKFSFVEQMANIGSEIERAISWKEKGNDEYSRRAFERGLELLDFTIADGKNKKRLKELTRLRETLADYFVFENEYSSTAESWKKYFFPYYLAARS